MPPPSTTPIVSTAPPATSVTTPNKLTPSLTKSQLMQNIDALQKGGMQNPDVQKYVNNYSKGTDGSYSLKQTPVAKPDPLASVHGDGGLQPENPVTSVENQANSGVSQIKEGLGNIFNPQGTDVTGNAVKGGEGALEAESGLASIVTSPLAPIFRVVNDMIKKAGEGYATLPAVQEFAKSPSADTAIRVLQDLSNAGNVAGTIAGGTKGAEKAPAAAKTVADTTKGVIEQGKGAIEKAKTFTEEPPEETAARTQQAQEKAHGAIETEIRNTAAKYPTTVGKTLNQAETARGTEPIKVLSSYPEGKALPKVVKGKLQTDTASAFLKGQIGRLSEIKNKLIGTAKDSTSVEDFKQAALDRISKQNWSVAKKAQESAGVSKLLDGLEETYPEGIPAKEMDLLKTEHANESKSYNSKSTFSPDTHAIIGQTAKDVVETQGGDAPIEELNKLISSHYDAMKLLEKMRGKTPHGGAMSRFMNNTIGEITGLAGGMAVGHPFIGAMAGRAGAEAISDIINNHFISNPLKRTLVNNMKGADPDVVGKALDYLEKTK